MRPMVSIFVLLAVACAQTPQTPTAGQKQQILWQKLESTINDVDRNLDGVLGGAIEDLTTGQKSLLHADDVFPTASSIKIAVLAELYHQAQTGKLKLTDLYTMRSADLVPDSDIMGGLTPGVTQITLRDLATMMVAVSDNSATNVLIDRVGMENVNALMDSLGLTHTRLRRKMMDLKAASEGRENISTPAEMMTLLEDLYRGKVLNKEMTADFFKVLATHKDSWIPRDLPDDLKIADKPGARKKRMRIGRGIGSGKGKTAGRGGKGQTARSGVRIKGFEGGQMPLHRRLPKRGFNNIFARDYAEVNLGAIQKLVDAGTLGTNGTIDHDALKAALDQAQATELEQRFQTALQTEADYYGVLLNQELGPFRKSRCISIVPDSILARSRMFPTNRFSRSVSSRIVVSSSRCCRSSWIALASSRLVTPALIDASGVRRSWVTDENIAARSWFVSASSCARRARASSRARRGGRSSGSRAR